jgi:SAM-dependent methyltransferase
MSRIYQEKISLEPDAVHAFFESRGEKLSVEHPLTSVLYQDNNPDLAKQRDAFEKNRIKPLLRLHDGARVLDIGCGIGRWADALADSVSTYHGVDFSASLIEAARSRNQHGSCSFEVLAAQDVHLDKLPSRQRVSHVLIAGVLLYLNDDDVLQTLHAAADSCEQNALIYIREPIAIDARLTLKDFPSTELGSQYSAIYRSLNELNSAFEQTLLSKGFELSLSEKLYPPDMNNRQETTQHIFIFARI